MQRFNMLFFVCRQDWAGWACTRDSPAHFDQIHKSRHDPPSMPEASWLMTEQLGSSEYPLNTTLSHLAAAGGSKPSQVQIADGMQCILFIV